MARPIVYPPAKKIQPYQLADNLRFKKYYFENFVNGANPLWFKVTAGMPVLPTAADTNVGVAIGGMTPLSQYWEFYNTTEQDIMTIGTANGLNISGDLVNNEALELVPGGNSATSRLAFVAGTDSDFFIRAKFLITDADGTDQFVVGFRKQEAFAVPVSFLAGGAGTYTDYFGVGFATNPTVNPNAVATTQSVASAVATVQDTNFKWTDGQVHQLEVRVIGRRAIVFLNGVRLGNPVTKDGDGASITSQTTLTGPVYSFTSALTLVPFIFLRHDTTVSESLLLREIEIGHLSDIGKDPNRE